MNRGLTATEIFEHLKDSNLPNIPSRTTVFDWFRRFQNGRTSFDDDERCGRPVTCSDDDSTCCIRQLVEANPRQSTRTIAEQTGLSKNTVHRILVNVLGFRKVCSVWVPHRLSEANKIARVECCKDLIHLIDSHSMTELLEKWITEDETWALHESTSTKQENAAWLHPSQKRLTVVRPHLTNKKTLLLIAFSGDGKLNIDYTAPKETVTAERYTDFVKRTGEKWRHLRTSPIHLKNVWWQHDNARPHTAVHTKEFFNRRKIHLIPQSAYSPDLNQCDFWLFKFLKKELRSQKLTTHEEVRNQTVQLIRSLPRDRFVTEIRRMYDHCKSVIEVNGNYI